MLKNRLHHVLKTMVPSLEDNGDKIMDELSIHLNRKIDALPKDITAPLGKLRYPGMSKAYVDNNNTLDLTVTPVDMDVVTLTDPKDVATVVKHMGNVLDVICKMEQISIGHLHIDSLSDARANTFTRLEYLGISPIFDYTYINPWSGSYMGDWYGVSDLLTDHLEACMKLIRDSTTNTKPSNESVITAVALGISLIAISSLAVGVGKLVKKGLDKLESVISNAINKTYKKRVESTLSTLDQVRLFLDELPNRSTLPRSTSSGVWVSNLACSGKLDSENPMDAINGNIRLIADIGRATTTTCDKSDRIVSVILSELDYSAKVIATLPQYKIDGANEYVGSTESYSDDLVDYIETRFKADENRMTSRINEHIETLEANVSSLEAMQTALLCPETRDLTIVMCQGGVRSIGRSYGLTMAPSVEGRLPNHRVISTEVDNLLSLSKVTLSKLTK